MSSRLRMVLYAALLVLAVIPAVPAGAQGLCDARVNNTVNKLLQCVTVDGVREHQAAFQAIADANGGTRASGTEGYNQSVAYVADRMEAAGYDVTVQEFEFNAYIPLGPATLDQVAPVPTVYVQGTDFDVMSQSDAGDVTALVTAVDLDLGLDNSSTSGCEIEDFVDFPAGNIALVQRGACSFQLKAENAAASGAVGVIIFNQGNADGRFDIIGGTVGGEYSGGIPVMETTYYLGEEWAGTEGLEMHMIADVFRELAPTYNVIAETPGGDPNNVVMAGAHLDSVPEGPGIQDNGSGSAAILEVAEQMAGFQPNNKVRFAWWGAEESGLLGSEHYVGNLSEDEIADIALYLNFDMIGSPNFVYFIYDGDDSDGVGAGPGPAGSAAIEQAFERFYETRNAPYLGTDFSGRSDYGPFIEVGIPSGGLFTGAEGIKTDEEAAVWGGTAGDQYDPCYHLACDTFDNISLEALGMNADAVAAVVFQFGKSTKSVNGARVYGAGGEALAEFQTGR